jgi:hypothetical protein
VRKVVARHLLNWDDRFAPLYWAIRRKTVGWTIWMRSTAFDAKAPGNTAWPDHRREKRTFSQCGH